MASQRIERRGRRRERVRATVRGTDRRPRLSVYRSLHHVYAQVVSDESGRTLAAASTLSADLKGALKNKSNATAAKAVGMAIAQRCAAANISQVIFDRNGFLYHGVVKSVADAAREAGLKF